MKAITPVTITTECSRRWSTHVVPGAPWSGDGLSIIIMRVNTCSNSPRPSSVRAVKPRIGPRRCVTCCKGKVGGVSRVLKSASGLRRGRGLCGTAKAYDQAYGYLKKRRQWMQYHSYRRQKLPIGSGITEAACKVVFTQRLKRSGMAWTIEGGQVILDLRVIWLSGVWDQVQHRYLAAKPLPLSPAEKGQDEQGEQEAA